MESKIKDALAKLDVNNDNHWTSDGLPKVDTVKMLAGDQTLDRAAITKADPSFNRDAAKAATAGTAGSAETKPQGGEQAGDQGQGTAPAAGAPLVGEQVPNNGAPQGDAVVVGSPTGDLPVVRNEDGGQAAMSADAHGNILAVGQDQQAQLAPQVVSRGGAVIAEGTQGTAEDGEFEGDADSTEGQIAALDKEVHGYDEEIRTIQAKRTDALQRRYDLHAKRATEQNVSHADTVRGYLDSQERQRKRDAELARKRSELGL